MLYSTGELGNLEVHIQILYMTQIHDIIVFFVEHVQLDCNSPNVCEGIEGPLAQALGYHTGEASGHLVLGTHRETLPPARKAVVDESVQPVERGFVFSQFCQNLLGWAMKSWG